MAARKPRVGDWAFWSYDLFPYMLSARIKKVEPDGRIHAEGYDGFRFKTIHIIPGAEGQRMDKTLRALRAENIAAKENLQNDFRRRLVKLAPFVKKGYYTGWKVR